MNVRTADVHVRSAAPRSLRRVLSQALVSPRSTDPAKRRPTDFFVGVACVALGAAVAGAVLGGRR